MRTLLKLTVNTLQYEPGAFAAGRRGALAQAGKALFGPLKPEATYFLFMHGRRTALVVFDLKDPSEIPAITESFARFGATDIELFPVMNAADLNKGLPEVTDRINAVISARESQSPAVLASRPKRTRSR
jgi:hypothetical protein